MNYQLTKAEIQSGLDRVRWAEGLIEQLPPSHEGRNSWLLNYGQGAEANKLRTEYRHRPLAWNEATKSAVIVEDHSIPI